MKPASIQYPAPSTQYPAPASYCTAPVTHHASRITHQPSPPLSRARAFTLIELLVVIAVISLLAAMIVPITGAVTRNRGRVRARAELEQIVTALEQYKATLGHYPPDNPGNVVSNQLYFELLGTTNNGVAYVTLDGSASINVADVPKIFGPNVTGFVNANRPGAGDELRTAKPFLKTLKPTQYATIVNQVRLLTCSLPAPILSSPSAYPVAAVPGANPWRYNSSNPTNNPTSFDLWIDIVISGKTNRISNWSKDALTVGTP